MNIEELKQQSQSVTMSNALIRSAHSLTLQEKRIVALALSGLDSFEEADEHANLIVKIRALDFASLFSVSESNSYDTLQKCAKSLLTRKIRMSDKDNRVTEMNWLSYSTYAKSEGWCEVKFNSDLVPHLFGLKKQFTQYRLERFRRLKSEYSWRILELLAMFAQTGFLTISVEELVHAVDAPDSYASDYGALRRRVIEPALKEIRNSCEMTVSVVAKKLGKKVVRLEFTFSVIEPADQEPAQVIESAEKPEKTPYQQKQIIKHLLKQLKKTGEHVDAAEFGL
jgi:plasmid replication initiation protein